jgi:hypothetical protein
MRYRKLSFELSMLKTINFDVKKSIKLLNILREEIVIMPRSMKHLKHYSRHLIYWLKVDYTN